MRKACCAVIWAPVLAAAASAAVPSPVAVSPSQFFEGIDGSWSTFELRVGSPAQNVRLLPATASTQTLVVSDHGCDKINVTNCANSRGELFNSAASSTWKPIGEYILGIENALDYKDAGDFGHDTVGLGYLGSGGPVVDNSVVASVNGTEFYFGILGLNPRPTNFTTQNDPQPSFLQLLKNQSYIPSLSYSYTAGAPYRLNKALGSLILGGYDSSAFAATSKTFNFFSDQSVDLTVGLQSISTNSTTGVETSLSNGLISMFIDSSIADIYLPVTACQAFEKAFGLTWDAAASMYFVDDALHSKLAASNPSVTFTITTPITGGASFNITLPYASFDLQASPPLVKQTTRYFPLKQAANNTQYIFGRTFLQEAYLIVDYERGTFSVNPKTWDPNAKADIVAILPPGAASAAPSLGGGAIAGIVLGVLVFIAAVAIAILRFLVLPRRRKAVAELEAAKSPDPAVSELASAFTSTLGSPVSVVKTEAVSEGSRLSELASPAPISEILSSEIYEMEGTDVAELDAGEPARELDGRDTERSPYMPPLKEQMEDLHGDAREMHQQTEELDGQRREKQEQTAEMDARARRVNEWTAEHSGRTMESHQPASEPDEQTTGSSGYGT